MATNKPNLTPTSDQTASSQTGKTPGPTVLPPPMTDRRKNLPVIIPENAWPPPIFVHPDATPEEIYYIENRWYAQWAFYDSRAGKAKKNAQRVQLAITVGSAAVPVLVGIQAIDDRVNFGLYIVTIVISFVVAGASAIETVMKYADSWRNYRTATEELMREKSLYDVRSGPYRKSNNPFLLFVERCEDIMAKQNGVFLSPREEQQQQAVDQPANFPQPGNPQAAGVAAAAGLNTPSSANDLG